MKKIMVLATLAMFLLTGCGQDKQPETFQHVIMENIEVEEIHVETIQVETIHVEPIHVNEIHFEDVTTYWD